MSACSSGRSLSLPATWTRAPATAAGSPAMGSVRRRAPERKPCKAASSGGADTAHLVADRARLVGLGHEHGEGGDVVVPLDQRGDGAAAAERATVEIPHRIDHVVAVRVEDVRAL